MYLQDRTELCMVNAKFPAGCIAFLCPSDAKYLLLEKIYHCRIVTQIPFRWHAKGSSRYLTHTKSGPEISGYN